MAVVWLCLSVCFNGAVYSGFQVRFTKIPNFFQNLTISSKQMSQFQIQDQLYSKKKRWLQFLKPGIEKGPDHLGPGWGIWADFWVLHKIQS